MKKLILALSVLLSIASAGATEFDGDITCLTVDRTTITSRDVDEDKLNMQLFGTYGEADLWISPRIGEIARAGNYYQFDSVNEAWRAEGAVTRNGETYIRLGKVNNEYKVLSVSKTCACH